MRYASGYTGNLVRLRGTIDEISMSHESYGEKFCKGNITLPTGDDFEVIINARIINALNLKNGEVCDILGNLRNYSSICGKQIPSRVFASTVGRPSDSLEVNTVELIGKVGVVSHKSPVTEILIEVPRVMGLPDSSYDIVSCAAWDPVSEGLEVGKRIHVVGTLKARRFRKRLADGNTEERKMYEVHIKKWEEFKDVESKA